MAINLRADNRAITTDGKSSYLIDNYPSGVSTVSIGNTEGFFHNSYVVSGNIGSENTEILQLDTVDRTTGALTFRAFTDLMSGVTNSAATTIINFTTNKTFVVGQPVTVKIGDTEVTRGTGTVQTSGTGTAMTIVNTGGVTITAVIGDRIIVSDVTRFAHAESSRLTVIPYNKVRFFRTETPQVPNAVPYTTRKEEQDSTITETTLSTMGNTTNTTIYTKPGDPSYIQTVDYTPQVVFDGAATLSPLLDIQVNDFYTTYADNSNYDGYGWYAFYSDTTGRYSPISSFIPYAGFADNTVSEIFKSFDSELNTKEIKLISQSDRFTWLNEAASLMTNELNLGNWEYMASEDLTLTIKAGISAYLLPNNFSNLLYVNDDLNLKVDHFEATFARPQASSRMKYMIRGKHILFEPTPTEDSSVTLGYLAKSSQITRLDQTLNFPDNAHYFLKDYMLYRAYRKLGNSTESAGRYTVFNANIDKMKIYSIKRDNGLDSWGMAPTSNV